MRTTTLCVCRLSAQIWFWVCGFFETRYPFPSLHCRGVEAVTKRSPSSVEVWNYATLVVIYGASINLLSVPNPSCYVRQVTLLVSVFVVMVVLWRAGCTALVAIRLGSLLPLMTQLPP